MKGTDQEMIFKSVGGSALLPVNQLAHEFCLDNRGEVCLKDITTRDLSFHRCYFLLIHTLYDRLPHKFKQAVPKTSFHTWLKHLQGKYKVAFTFKDGTKLVEYESISFGRMSQTRFKEYIREQMPFLYEDVVLPLLGDAGPAIWESIEDEFENFLNQLQ